jgi:hypothetical protein
MSTSAPAEFLLSKKGIQRTLSEMPRTKLDREDSKIDDSEIRAILEEKKAQKAKEDQRTSQSSGTSFCSILYLIFSRNKPERVVISVNVL